MYVLCILSCGRSVSIVMSVESPSVLDTCFTELPLYQAIGDQMHTTFTALRQYEGFASDISERAGVAVNHTEEKPTIKKGLFYLLTFTVDYDSGKLLTKTCWQDVMRREEADNTSCRL